MNKFERLTQIRNDLESIHVKSFADWEQIKSWINKATPIFITDWKEFIEDFRSVTKQPKWFQLARVGGGPDSDYYNKKAASDELSANFSIVFRTKNEILEFVNGILSLNPESSLNNPMEKNMNSNKVFIVHGHDHHAKEQVARFLEKIELQAIILHEQASGGRTVIEKLEHYTDVDFAVVLLTPDDVGSVKTNKENLQPRARQNVILELGYMMAKLGRHNVCALLKESVEKPSDYDGVVYISMDDNGAWKQGLAQEMKDAGVTANFQKLFS